MNASRITRLFLLSLIAPFSFAGLATITEVKGTAGPVLDNVIKVGKLGEILPEGTLVETGEKSGLKLRISNGGKLVIGAKTRLILRFNDDDVLEISLIRGSISGDFKKGTTVRTNAGVVFLNDVKSALQFSDGALVVAPANGNSSVQTTGKKGKYINVPAGTTAVIRTDDDAHDLSPMENDQIDAVLQTEVALEFTPPKSSKPAKNYKTSKPGGKGKGDYQPDLSKINDISPGV